MSRRNIGGPLDLAALAQLTGSQPPPWHSRGRAPLRLSTSRSEQRPARRRAQKLPAPDALEEAKKALRRLERERLRAAPAKEPT